MNGINITNFLLLLSCLILINFVVAIIFRRKFEETAPFSIVFIVFIIYWFALFDIIKIGLYFILFLFIMAVAYIIKQKKTIVISDLFSVGFFIYLFLCLIMAIIFKEYFLYAWDEFTHWGITAKDMYLDNKIIPRAYSDYPIGTRLFQYFILKIYGSYSESVLLLYFYLIYFTFALYPLKNISFRSIHIALFYSTLVFILPSFFIIFFPDDLFQIFRALLVDLLLGLTFGFCIFFILKNNGFNKFSRWFLFFLLFFLVQIKAVAIILAVVIVIFIILINKSLKEGIFFSASVVLAKTSWSAYTNFYGYTNYLKDRMNIAFINILKEGNINNQEGVYDFLNSYLSAMINRPIFIYYSYLQILIFLLCIAGICYIIIFIMYCWNMLYNS